MIFAELRVVEVGDNLVSLRISVKELKFLDFVQVGELFPGEGHGGHPDDVAFLCGEGVEVLGYIFYIMCKYYTFYGLYYKHP